MGAAATVLLVYATIDLSSCQQGICDQEFGSSGQCFAYTPMFSYNKAQGKCQEFIYGGCGGNYNKFDTLAQCQALCEKNTGPGTCDQEFGFNGGPPYCTAAIPMFSYNKAKGKCQQFIYGGCNGNDNQFDTLAQCQALCEKNTGPDRCREPGVLLGWKDGWIAEHTVTAREAGADECELKCQQNADCQRWTLNTANGWCALGTDRQGRKLAGAGSVSSADILC